MIILSPKKEKAIDHKKYEDILGRISPIVKSSAAAKERQDLIDKVIVLKQEKEETKKEKDLLRAELDGVYNSRRWKIATKAANIKGKIFK